MIDAQMYLFGAIAVVLVLIVSWVQTVWEMRGGKSDDVRDRFGEQGVVVNAVRKLYGARVIEFADTGEEGYAQSHEICEAEHASYTRLMVDFPTRLSVQLTLLKESKGELFKRLMSLREVEIGDAEFDDEFLILAHSKEEFEAHVDAGLRALLMQMSPLAAELKLGPDGVFMQCYNVLDGAALAGVLEQIQTLAQKYYTTAKVLEDLRETKGEEDELAVYDEGHFGLHTHDL